MQGETSHKQSEIPPPAAAFDAYMSESGRLGDQPVVVIEGGYFEQRDPRAEDRMEHLRDSFLLVDRLLAIPEVIRPKIIIAVLINDFWSAGPYCGLDYCQLEPMRETVEHRAKGLRLIPEEAWRIYQEHGETIAKCHVKLFSMKSTRNRAAKTVAKALKVSDRASTGLHEVVDGDVVDIYIYTDYEELHLGCRRKETFQMSLRCTALMAQHYFDLYLRAREYAPRMTGLWIFDFDRLTEQDRVRAGAEASFVMYPWPDRLPVKVINCIYAPGGARRKPLQITVRR